MKAIRSGSPSPIFLTLTLSLTVLSLAARDYSHPVGYYRLQSNHSITTTLLGLEYSFEGRIADRWTLIGRAGLVPTGFNVYSYPDAAGFEGNMGLGASFEARYYSSIKRRTETTLTETGTICFLMIGLIFSIGSSDFACLRSPMRRSMRSNALERMWTSI